MRLWGLHERRCADRAGVRDKPPRGRMGDPDHEGRMEAFGDDGGTARGRRSRGRHTKPLTPSARLREEPDVEPLAEIMTY